jgi:hypothetical protein
MQAEITEFENNGEIFKLFGNYENLNPKLINGIAHAFKSKENWILTFFSETGIESGGKPIASADLRIAISLDDLVFMTKMINELTNFKPDSLNEENKNLKLNKSKVKEISETLGEPL